MCLGGGEKWAKYEKEELPFVLFCFFYTNILGYLFFFIPIFWDIYFFFIFFRAPICDGEQKEQPEFIILMESPSAVDIRQVIPPTNT